jgi:Fic family protein
MRPDDFIHGFPGKLVATPFDTKGFVPDRLPLSLPFDPSLRRAEEEALLALGALQTIPHLLPQHRTLFTSQYMRRESVLSSKIEGTSTKIGQLFLFEADERHQSKTAYDATDAKTVHNAHLALEAGLSEVEKKPISCALLRGVHAALFKDLPDIAKAHPGSYRTTQAFVGSQNILKARYVAPPSMFVEELMQDLETYINEFMRLNTLTKIALVHYQFESIHPFTDGNGRVGRILISLMLKASGLLSEPPLYLSAYFDENLRAYVQHLWEVSSKNRWSEWITFFLNGVKREAKDAVSRAHNIINLREEMRQQWQRSKGTAAVLDLIDDLFYRPTVNIQRAAKVMKRTTEAARINVEKLVAMGVLREVTGYSRNRIFIAPQIIQLLE